MEIEAVVLLICAYFILEVGLSHLFLLIFYLFN
jgi:hypothetical protein